MEELFSPEFWAVVSSKQREGQRKGQAVFNTAADFFPTESRKLSGTFADPFYHDYRIEAFLTGIVEYLTR